MPLTYYTSTIAAVALAPDLTEVDLPSSLAVSAQYGETIINGAQPGAATLEGYILSAPAQAVLAANGFGPPAPVPERASLALIGMGLAGHVAARRQRTPS